MQLEIINRLFLELSQIATAKTSREIELEEQINAVRKEEREACAKIADDLYHGDNSALALVEYDGDVSSAIRSRSAV